MHFGSQYNLSSLVIITKINIINLVGYGDVKVRSNWGRFTCLLTCIWGTVMWAIFVVSTKLFTEFDVNEE
jgi:hypothetical protein